MDADDEEARREILRRRAIFVATALAGIAVTGCSSDDGDAAPQACLKIAVSSSGSASAAPRTCLKVAVDTVTPQPSSSSAPSGPTAESPSATPSVPSATPSAPTSKVPSLPRTVPTPPPQVCLSPRPPKVPKPG